jgi:hypothetical protein
MTAVLLDRLETPTLVVGYTMGDPTLAVDFCPQEVIDKPGEFALVCDGILFRVTDTNGGSTTWDVTRDSRTADHNIVSGSPVYIWLTAWQIEELLDALEATIPVASDDDPQPTALTADPGVSDEYSRADHVHEGAVGGGGGGGGTAFGYAGTTTQGASTETITNNKQYFKLFTLTEETLITSVAAYVEQNTTSSTVQANAGIFTDVAGEPGRLIAAVNGSASPVGFLTGGAGEDGWLDLPVSVRLPAGTYHAGVQFFADTPGGADFRIYYDTGGADMISTAGNFYLAGDAVHATSDSTRDFSIRVHTVVAQTAPGLVLLEQHTASGSATLDFTTFISASYDEYLFEFDHVIPATDGVALWMRMGTGGGPTFDTGANYSWEAQVWSAATAAFGGSTGDTKLSLSFTTHVSNSANWGICGKLRLFDPGSAIYKQVEGNFHFYANDPVRASVGIGGAYESATAVTAIRFLFSSGTIASGTIRVYGVAK